MTTKAYDDLVQKLLDEGKVVSRSEARRKVSLRRERNPIKVERMIPGPLTEIAEGLQPKKRGWPKGKLRKPKV